MRYRRLGRAGVKVSVVGLGTWLNFGGDQEAANRLVDAAVEAGINFFDTANTDGRGAAELALGAALARHDRDQVVLATKVWGPMGDGPNDSGLSRKHVMAQCEASLRRLGVDCLDLYQCQRYDPETMLEETLRALDDLHRAGKIHYWGVSGWTPTEVGNAVQLADGRGWVGPASCQTRYNLLDPESIEESSAACRRHGLGLLAYSPLAQGVLTGKYRAGQVPAGSRLAHDRLGANLRSRYGELVGGEVVETVCRIAAERDATPAQVALAAVLARDEVVAALTGATRPEQVLENAGAAELALDTAELAALGAG